MIWLVKRGLASNSIILASNRRILASNAWNVASIDEVMASKAASNMWIG
ncbi:hypothetical protein [Solibacillus cecembensis]